MALREIEVKAKVWDAESLLRTLEKLGCHLSEASVQIDRIFIPRGSTIPAPKGINILRLRKEKEKVLFTLKQVNENQLDKIEKEFFISDEKAAVDTIELLGFEESVSVEKKRRKCKFKDYEICLDEVKGLGLFIEVEKFTDANTEVVQKELFAFLQTLGIHERNRVFVGYDILLYDAMR